MAWYQVVLLASVVVLASGSRSPNADIVEKFLKTSSGERHSSNIVEDATLDVPGLVRKYGYPIEEHDVETSDGYLIRAHRIRHGRRGPTFPPWARVPVLIMHGMMCSSADFLVLGPENALGYLLADAGYDVWLANARGNYYSRRHVSLDPNDREGLEFWKFSWDEIGNRDLPALVNHITVTTGHLQMHYIGYSQGTTAFLVLNSLRPLYNRRFLSFQALAPAAYTEHNENDIRSEMVKLERVLDYVAFSLGFGEIMPRSDFLMELGLEHCSDGALLQPLCVAIVVGEVENFNTTMMPVFLGHNPAGAATRQIIHYAQVTRFQRFARYNFGAAGNLMRYGRVEPPEYDVTRVTVPTFIHYSEGDAQADYRDVLLLAERMHGADVTLHEVERKSFNHFDFIWGGDAKVQVYDRIIAAMRSVDGA